MDKLQIIKSSLINGLVIDDQTGDSTISYSKSQIDNKFEVCPTIDELHKIYIEDNDADLFVNTKNCIMLILEDGTEIPLNEYKKEKKYKKGNIPVFIKIFNIDLLKSDNEIIIALNSFADMPEGDYDIPYDEHYIRGELCWQTEPYQISNDYTCMHNLQIAYHSIEPDNYNGWKNTTDLIKSLKDIKKNTVIKPCNIKLPAIKYCQDIKYTLGKSKYQGYLPAIGQLIFLFNYISLINHIIKSLKGFEPINHKNKMFWWTSDDLGVKNAMAFNKNMLMPTYFDKNMALSNSAMNTFPFFKKLK